MLFNSYEFVLLFVPIVLAGFYLVGAIGGRFAIAWLVLASFFFYAYWRPPYLLLLVASVAINYAIGARIARLAAADDPRRKYLLAAGVVANVAALAYFKYTSFLIANIGAVAGADLTIGDIVLPIGISFYTFQQIAYLVDASRGHTDRHSFIDYCLFVAFFPQLIAGPIVHHREMLKQFANAAIYRFDAGNVAAGVTFFVIGLFKKVVLADTLAQYASPVFAAARDGTAPTLVESWSAALAYTLQLYFDFSGYCDMAIGLGLLFNIRLPVNFDSPYKAVSIVDFWRRWHITLSRFLRDYLYIALGGNRHGPARRYLNIFLTMLIGGIWHGAGWTFVVWGAIHGFYLVVNHFWRAMRVQLGFADRHGAAGAWLARGVTLLAVIVGWVVFRAESLDAARQMLRGMAGLNGIVISPHIAAMLGEHAFLLDALGVTVGPSPLFGGVPQAAWIAVLMAVVLLAPNSQQLMGYVAPNREETPSAASPAEIWPRWSLSQGWAVAAAVAFLYTLTQMSNVSEFLYFQF
jgi:D-alanyl-lipoteichoic acid acyltransferase DltB (MBOAT superfamily)